jgi:hypothetical protein
MRTQLLRSTCDIKLEVICSLAIQEMQYLGVADRVLCFALWRVMCDVNMRASDTRRAASVCLGP